MEPTAAVVPTPDGGFSALALRAPVAGLSQAFRYGGSNALEALISFLEGRALRVRVLAPWRDIDRPEDLQD